MIAYFANDKQLEDEQANFQPNCMRRIEGLK